MVKHQENQEDQANTEVVLRRSPRIAEQPRINYRDFFRIRIDLPPRRSVSRRVTRRPRSCSTGIFLVRKTEQVGIIEQHSDHRSRSRKRGGREALGALSPKRRITFHSHSVAHRYNTRMSEKRREQEVRDEPEYAPEPPSPEKKSATETRTPAGTATIETQTLPIKVTIATQTPEIMLAPRMNRRHLFNENDEEPEDGGTDTSPSGSNTNYPQGVFLVRKTKALRETTAPNAVRPPRIVIVESNRHYVEPPTRNRHPRPGKAVPTPKETIHFPVRRGIAQVSRHPPVFVHNSRTPVRIRLDTFMRYPVATEQPRMDRGHSSLKGQVRRPGGH
ncbi:hypothetical protein Q1695_014107 [Nippostrongylus brasiliensis]|nr:hypothetical protein Q1695_014107 [Nippostrongylus brasiliensis]